MAPTLAVITPSYNQGRFIARTIDSVLSQGVPVDYVVVDGGSKDETVDVLKSYGETIRWVSERDRGQSDAINKGLRMTQGDIICWLNSDDVYFPGTLEKVVAFFEANPDVDVVYGNAQHIDEDDGFINDYPTEPWDFERLKETCFLSQPAVFFRRRAVDKAGAIDDSLAYCMDYELWLRFGQAGIRFAHVPELFAGSRLYETNKTLGARMKVHAEINTMMKKRFGKVPDRWLSNYAHVKLDEAGRSHADGFSFIALVGMHTLITSLRWNHSISPSLMKLVGRWYLGGMARSLKLR